MKKLMTAMAMTAILAMSAGDLTAQGSINGNASVTIPEVLVITSVSDLTILGGDFDFTGSTTSTASGDVTVETRSNVLHAVDVTGAALTQGGDNLTLEVEDADGNWGTVSGTEVKALDNLARGVQSSTITFRTEADIELHAPGEYTGTITYTAVANY